MTFGNKGWGSPDEVSRELFDAYVDAGGSFVARLGARPTGDHFPDLWRLEDGAATEQSHLPPGHAFRTASGQLRQASAFEPGNFYTLFQGQTNRSIFGGVSVESWSGGLRRC